MARIKEIIRHIKYFFSAFYFLKIYFSPFKFPKPVFYIGPTRIGTPYFLPRKWVLSENKKSRYAVPKKIGFDFIALTYKTKWHDTDYRYEYGPIWSFVFFGYQIAITFELEDEEVWICWIHYDKCTDKSLSVKERIKQAREAYPCNWTRHFGDGSKADICYWDIGLKQRYR